MNLTSAWQKNRIEGAVFEHITLLKTATGLCTFIILACLLAAGLWPFNFFPHNKVSLSENGAIHFLEWSQALSEKPLEAIDSRTPLSINLIIKPERYSYRRVSRILSFMSGTGKEMAYIGQWGPHLIVRNTTQPSQNHPYTEMSVRDALNSGKEVFVTVTSNDKGTIIYLNGRLAESSKSLQLTHWDTGNPRLLLGNSPDGNHPWRGSITTLSIHNTLLKMDQISKFLISVDGESDPLPGTVLHYRFEEGSEPFVDRSGSNNNLIVPDKFAPIKRRFFELSFEEFKLTHSRVSDISLNFMGFVPLGFVFSVTLLLFLSGAGRWNPILVFFTGTGISLVIETGQVFLPSRTSSMSDLILNCIGTVAGILIFEASATSFRAGMRYQTYLSNGQVPKDQEP